MKNSLKKLTPLIEALFAIDLLISNLKINLKIFKFDLMVLILIL